MNLIATGTITDPAWICFILDCGKRRRNGGTGLQCFKRDQRRELVRGVGRTGERHVEFWELVLLKAESAYRTNEADSAGRL